MKGSRMGEGLLFPEVAMSCKPRNMLTRCASISLDKITFVHQNRTSMHLFSLTRDETE